MAGQGGDIEEAEYHSAMEEDPDKLAIQGPVTRAEWCNAIQDRIKQLARDVEQPIPASHRRVEAVINNEQSHPSIFKLQGQPNKVSTAAIGPYHRSAPAQPVINDGKKSNIVRYLASKHHFDTSQFLGWAVQHQEKILRCYEKDSFEIAADKLAMMLLLDGCLLLFAILHLRSGRQRDQRVSHLAERGSDWLEFIKVSADITIHMKGLRLDMLMLDNQIPFFVVAMLYDQLRDTLFQGIDERIEAMALSCFDDIHPRCSHAKANSEVPQAQSVHHLLHLFHWSRIPSNKYMVTIDEFLPKEPKAHLPSATELRESATLFRQSSSGSIVDVTFRRNWMGAPIIRIPAVYVCDYSESIFRNLIAFEQSHMRCSLSVTAYSISMTHLLQSEADAKILRENRILAYTEKTGKDIVNFFRGLRVEYQNKLQPGDLMRLYDDVARHHENRLDRMCGGVMLQYWPNPWILISVVCAIILFLFTVAYNIHNLYRDYHPLRH